MRHLANIGILLISVAGCATYAPPPLADFHRQQLDALPPPPDEAMLAEMAKDGLHELANFYDPYSVVIEIKDVVKSYHDVPQDIFGTDRRRMKGWFVCGTYNAKNRMGGYTGENWFIMILDERDQERLHHITISYVNDCEDLNGGVMERHVFPASKTQ